jgi:hypothetical protein
MEPFQGSGGDRRRGRFNPLRERGGVNGVEPLGRGPDTGKGRAINRKPKIFDPALLEPNRVGALVAIWIAGRIVDLHLVETRGQCCYVSEAVENGSVFKSCDGSGNEDAKMADMGIDEIDDPLPGTLEVVGILIDNRDLSKRLMGRRDVIPIGGEYDDGITDPAEIREAMVANPQRSLFQAVAHKEVLDDCENFFAAEKIKAAPPALEGQKSLALRIDMKEQIGVFLPHCFRLQRLEILDEPGAVEPTITKIGSQVRQPGAAEKPAGNTHGIDAEVTRPIGEWRSIEDNRPDETFTVSGEQGDRPSGLAITIQDW